MTAPGEKLLIKFWETITEKGIGTLLRPWQIRREGKANIDIRVNEMLALAQAEQYAENIRSGRMMFSKGQLLPSPLSNEQKQLPDNGNQPHLDCNTLVQVVNKNTIADSIRREVNVSKALLHTEESLEKDPQEPSEKNIDEDWLYRWRDYASTVSSEQLQTIWGRLLAGEIKAPGSYSLRTLDFLKNISQSEAESVTKLLRFAVNDFIFLSDKSLLENEGLKFNFLLEMQELGVISGAEGLGLKIDSDEKDKFFKIFMSHGKAIIATHDDATKKIILRPTIKISEIGKQILQLGKFEPHDKYLRKIGEAMKSQGFDVEMGDYVKINDKTIECSNVEKL